MQLTYPTDIITRFIQSNHVLTEPAGPDCLCVCYPRFVIFPVLEMIKQLNALGWSYQAMPFNGVGWSAFKLERIEL